MPAPPVRKGLIFPLPMGDPLTELGETETDDIPGGSGRRPVDHRGASHIGGAVLAGAAYVAWADEPSRGRPDGPCRSLPSPGRGPSDADQAAVVPRSA
jgi:hypothetical protein